jgi:GT2 family glycosyltransferase
MSKIGILVLNQNGRDWLPTVYESILSQTFREVSVYLVDNGSKDDSVALTCEQFPQVNVIRMPINLGYCMAYNLAMPYAFADGCEWVVWANNDIKVEPQCLEQLASAARTDPRIGVVGPAFLEWEGDKPNYYMRGNHAALCPSVGDRSAGPVDVEWVEGSFLMVSRQCVESVGPLDPYLFFYWEETDFCRRARYNGWRVVLAPGALGRHYCGGWSQAVEENRIAANKLQSRNSYIYKLANPFSGFARNFLEAVHLLLVHIKQCVIKKPSLALFHLQVFGDVLAHLPTLHGKWARDRRRDHPPKVQEGMLSVESGIIRGERAGRSSLIRDRAESL